SDEHRRDRQADGSQRRGNEGGEGATHGQPCLNRPSGFQSSTAVIITYTSTPAACGNSTLPNVSTAPTSRAATNAPRTEPMPPITTMTNETISTCPPMPG